MPRGNLTKDKCPNGTRAMCDKWVCKPKRTADYQTLKRKVVTSYKRANKPNATLAQKNHKVTKPVGRLSGEAKLKHMVKQIRRTRPYRKHFGSKLESTSKSRVRAGVPRGHGTWNFTGNN